MARDCHGELARYSSKLSDQTAASPAADLTLDLLTGSVSGPNATKKG